MAMACFEIQKAERLCRLLSEAVRGELVPPALSHRELASLLPLAKAHALAPLLSYRLSSLVRTEENRGMLAALEEEALLALTDRAKKDATLESVSRAFREAGIRHIPLKGAVLSRLYPEPWTRTSCDLDILISESDLERALTLLRDRGYGIGPVKEHDVAITTELGVLVELHYNISSHMPASAVPYLLEPFAHAEEVAPCRLEFQPAFLRLYALAHMAKHILWGGCGIRFVLDFWLIDRAFPKDSSLIEQAGLLPLADAVSSLARYWFEGEAPREETLLLAEHIGGFGVYGTKEESVSVITVRRGGRARYAFSRLFPPFSVMRFRYPFIRRHPIFLPFAYPVRLLQALLRKEDRARVKREAERSLFLSDEKKQELFVLLSYLGLEE